MTEDEAKLPTEGFMCGIAFQEELGNTDIVLYASKEELERQCSCATNGCGIVKVRVSLVKWELEQDINLMCATGKAGAQKPLQTDPHEPLTDQQLADLPKFLTDDSRFDAAILKLVNEVKFRRELDFRMRPPPDCVPTDEILAFMARKSLAHKELMERRIADRKVKEEWGKWVDAGNYEAVDRAVQELKP